jgi:hypothetical protein
MAKRAPTPGGVDVRDKRAWRGSARCDQRAGDTTLVTEDEVDAYLRK